MPALLFDVTTAPAPAAALRLMALDIKLSHSLFAMPFAVLAAFMAHAAAGQAWAVFARQLCVVIVCMVAARSWAMLINRLLDRRIDAVNPRTQCRAFASGALPAAQGWAAAGACAALFIAATAAFWLIDRNPWPIMLSVPVLAWIALYSVTKRFTALCHVWLGLSLAMAPVAAALAVEPGCVMHMPSLWLLAGFVACWVAGFDVIYALQDEAFDQAQGLHSIPAALGTTGARGVSAALHATAFVALVLAWRAHPVFGPIMGAGVLLVGVLLVVEHAIVARGASRGHPGLNMAFFTINGVVSCVLGGLGVVDVLI